MLQTSINAGTVATSVMEIESIVNQSGIEDQNPLSFNIVSQQFKRIADLNLALDEEVWNCSERESLV